MYKHKRNNATCVIAHASKKGDWVTRCRYFNVLMVGFIFILFLCNDAKVVPCWLLPALDPHSPNSTTPATRYHAAPFLPADPPGRPSSVRPPVLSTSPRLSKRRRCGLEPYTNMYRCT